MSSNAGRAESRAERLAVRHRRDPHRRPPGGIVVSIASPAEAPPAAVAEQQGRRAGFTIVEPDNGGLKEIAALIEAGRLRVEIDTVLPLEQAAKARELGEAGRTTGKIVLTVAG